MMRKRVLTIGVVIAIAALALSGCSGPGGPPGATSGGTGPITFIGNSDNAGNYKKLAAEWSARHPDQKVTYVEYSANGSDDARAQLVLNFQARSGRFDVIMANNVWTSEFAARKWISPLEKSAFPLNKLLPAPVQTGEYKGQLYAVPLYTDAGMLYYRSDLYQTPPTTFDEMKSECASAQGAPSGCFAGQFAQYDGLTVNFSEAVEDAGGHVIDKSGKPTVDTPQAKKGLQVLVDGFKEGWIPKEAITYKEDESRIAFQQGNLSLLRNWPYVYALASKAGSDSSVAGKFAVAPLPGITGIGKSALGGWNLALNTYSKHASTAKAFMAWLLQEPQQRTNLEMASLAPVWASLYDDSSLIAKYPYLPVLKKSLATAVPLPKTTNWSGTSLAIQKNAYAALQGQVSVDAALKQMQADLEQAVQNQ